MIIYDDPPRLLALDLTGPTGNAFVLLGIAKKVAGQLGWSKLRIKELHTEMMAGDYEHLLRVLDRELGHILVMYRGKRERSKRSRPKTA